MSTTTTPDGVTTVTLEDGRRLSYGPATTETGDAAEGFDWTRYSADDEIEMQDWTETGGQMDAVVAQFKSFAPRDRVRFEADGELRDGWYAGRWTEISSRVTLIPPDEWPVGGDGVARPVTYIRLDAEITPVPDKTGEK